MLTFLHTDMEEAFFTDVSTPLRSERGVIINLWAEYRFLCCRLFCSVWCSEKCRPDYIRSRCSKYDVKKLWCESVHVQEHPNITQGHLSWNINGAVPVGNSGYQSIIVKGNGYRLGPGALQWISSFYCQKHPPKNCMLGKGNKWIAPFHHYSACCKVTGLNCN